MKFVSKFKLRLPLSWKTLLPHVHGTLLVLVASLLYVLVEALTKLILNLAMPLYCHDSYHWLTGHVNTLCRVVGAD
jgi:hypothetical protein